MVSVLQTGSPAPDLQEKLGFQQKLQAVTNKVHATTNLDEIMVELS